jgi:hypothetical protein
VHASILSAEIGAPDEAGDNCYHVVVGADGAVLDGFTITGGNANGPYPHLNGGGILSGNVSMMIANCRFVQNVADPAAGSGGAIFDVGSACTDDQNATNAGMEPGRGCPQPAVDANLRQRPADRGHARLPNK